MKTWLSSIMRQGISTDIPTHSRVMTARFPSADTGALHDCLAMPSIWIVHAPHCAMQQPYLVPVKPMWSRKTQSSGVSDSTSTLYALLFALIVKFAVEVCVSQSICKFEIAGSMGKGTSTADKDFYTLVSFQLDGTCPSTAPIIIEAKEEMN